MHLSTLLPLALSLLAAHPILSAPTPQFAFPTEVCAKWAALAQQAGQPAPPILGCSNAGTATNALQPNPSPGPLASINGPGSGGPGTAFASSTSDGKQCVNVGEQTYGDGTNCGASTVVGP